MEKYIYTPLPKDHSEIRLIRLLPGRFEAEIQIQIFHAEISTNPKYEALSYTWGCPDETHAVHVEVPAKHFPKMRKILGRLKSKGTGKESKTTTTASLGVAENLFVALQHLRSATVPRVLWADAICINQKDDVERSAEVIEMGSIYNNATKVIVWLGPSSHDSDLAMQTLERIGEATVYEAEKGALTWTRGSWVEGLYENRETLADHADCWHAVHDVLGRPWFSRLWVFQEIALANQADVVVGAHVLDWKIAVQALWWIKAVAPQLDRQVESLGLGALFGSRIWPFLSRGCNPDLAALTNTLDLTSNLACSDARDRLYAIRSLLISSQRQLIVPDYTLSVKDVYTGFATKWLAELRDAEFLRFCSLPPPLPSSGSSGSVQRLDLPSWVPDWTRPRESSALNGRAAGHSASFSTVMDDSRLAIQGVLVASLSDVTPAFQVEALAAESDLRQLCRSLIKTVGEEDRAMEESPVDDSFVEMLVAGEVAERQASLDQRFPHRDQIRAFLSDDPNLDNEIQNRVVFLLRNALSGRLLFTTTDGAKGIGPQSARPGDHVAVILGCRVPLLLRPDQLSGETRYRVVGPCYIPGFMCAEALLGPLLPGWSWRFEQIEASILVVFSNENTRTRTQQDPRLPPLPPSWRYRYGLGDPPEEVEAEELKDMKAQWFENVETGEETWHDPRLNPDLLRERGVKVEELILI